MELFYAFWGGANTETLALWVAAPLNDLDILLSRRRTKVKDDRRV